MSSVAYGVILVSTSLVIYCCRTSVRRPSITRPEERFDEGECCLCLDEIHYEAQAVCGHLYCGELHSAYCIFAVWDHSHSKLSCPMCRSPISILFPNFEDNDQESSQAMLAISRYNYCYSDEARTVTFNTVDPTHLRRPLPPSSVLLLNLRPLDLHNLHEAAAADDTGCSVPVDSL
jgi:hypothetical protein